MKKIAHLSEVKVGEIKQFDFDGEDVILVNTGKEIIALSGVCPHADAPMEEGFLNPENTTVECSWHSSIFDLITGEVLEGPSFEGLTKFNVEIINDQIHIGLQ